MRPSVRARPWLIALVIGSLAIGFAAVSSTSELPTSRPTEAAAGSSPAPTTEARIDPTVATIESDEPRASASGEPAREPAGPSIAPATGSATSAIRPGSVNRSSLDLAATYAVTLRANWSTRSVLVGTTIVVQNTSGAAIDRIELNTIAAKLGGIDLRGSTVDGTAVAPTVSDQTIHLPLGGILDPGASTTVRLTYRATLRSTTSGSNWLFTRANGVLEMHRWIPWISRPTTFDRPNHGDPFVTPVSTHVRVRIISDRVIQWATTGEQIGSTDTDVTFDAVNVRDFAIVGAPDYRHTSTIVGTVAVRVWYRAGFPASTVLSAARTALSREAALLGAYPYRTYDLAQTAGGYGMESPGLTWIPTGAGSLGYLVAHETAHQWFYGIVGNDQARNPYADEAAADMVARNILGLRRASRCSTARLDLTIYQYSSACYYEDIYIQGGNFLDDLRKSMGTTAYWHAIRGYLAANRFQLSTTQRLLAAIDAGTSLDFRSRYHARFPSIY